MSPRFFARGGRKASPGYPDTPGHLTGLSGLRRDAGDGEGRPGMIRDWDAAKAKTPPALKPVRMTCGCGAVRLVHPLSATVRCPQCTAQARAEQKRKGRG